MHSIIDDSLVIGCRLSVFRRLVANTETNAMLIHIPNIVLLHIRTTAGRIEILTKHVGVLRLRASDWGA